MTYSSTEVVYKYTFQSFDYGNNECGVINIYIYRDNDTGEESPPLAEVSEEKARTVPYISLEESGSFGEMRIYENTLYIWNGSKWVKIADWETAV